MGTLDKTKRAKILIVDDVPANLIALQAVLSTAQYELIEANSGQEAVNLCMEQEFAAIVLDVHMPGMDGYKAARLIKQHGKNTEVPIMFLTATYSEQPHVMKGYEAGAIDYVGKPFDPDVLKAKVGIYADLYIKTKRLQETEALLASHGQIKALLDVMPVGVVVVDTSGKVYEMNEEAKRVWENGEACSNPHWDALNKVLQTGEAAGELVAEIRCDHGVSRTISSNAFPIRGRTGDLLGAVLIVQDLTTRQEVWNEWSRKTVEFNLDQAGSIKN